MKSRQLDRQLEAKVSQEEVQSGCFCFRKKPATAPPGHTTHGSRATGNTKPLPVFKPASKSEVSANVQENTL